MPTQHAHGSLISSPPCTTQTAAATAPSAPTAPISRLASVTPGSSRSLLFADATVQLGRVCRQAGWILPDYRSPPAMPGVVRTLRRRADGSMVVAVLLRDRPWDHVVADLIEGVVAANGLGEQEAEVCRRTLGRVLQTGQAPMAA